MSDHLDNKWTLFYWEVRKNWNPFARFCCFGMHSLWALSCYEAEKCDMKLNIKLNSKKIIPFNLALMLCNSCIVCKNWKNVLFLHIFFLLLQFDFKYQSSDIKSSGAVQTFLRDDSKCFQPLSTASVWPLEFCSWFSCAHCNAAGDQCSRRDAQSWDPVLQKKL